MAKWLERSARFADAWHHRRTSYEIQRSIATCCSRPPPQMNHQRNAMSSLKPTATAITRMAALDVGTNSIRLIVVEVLADGTYRLLDDEKEVTRLGLGLATTAKLSTKPMTESAAAIARMITIAEG